LVQILDKGLHNAKNKAFTSWRLSIEMTERELENTWLRDRLNGLMLENEGLRSEMHVLQF